MRSAGSENLRNPISGKGKVCIGDQELDCCGKDFILDKGVYGARNHSDQASLKVMIEEWLCDVYVMCGYCLKSYKIKCSCLK